MHSRLQYAAFVNIKFDNADFHDLDLNYQSAYKHICLRICKDVRSGESGYYFR